MKINRNEVFEFKTHQFMTEASTIGLPPGEFPDSIETDMGNGMPFVKSRTDGMDDIWSVFYLQELGCIGLQIVND